MGDQRRAGTERGAPPDGSFFWGVGIESSTLPHLDVDQFEWTQHNRFWRDDLRRAAEELGVRHLRYAIPWHYVEPEPGRFDWSVADERLSFCRELGLQPLLDVMHFGTPRWLRQAVGDPRFPEALERLTTAYVGRYGSLVDVWCPFNEPLVTSLFSGDFGFWPPHGRRWRGYMPVLARVAIATSRAIAAIRRAAPHATVLLCDAADNFQTSDESLASECRLRNLRRFLLLDLLSGRVDAEHPLFAWLTGNGMSDLDLEWFRLQPQMPDWIGLDYYAHSDWQLERGPKGMVQRRASAPAGLAGVARAYHERYALPLIVSETSIEGKPVAREGWLAQIVRDIRRLREDAVPLVGLVWWPLFDHVDWDGALTHQIGKLHEVGLYKLVRRDGELARVRTPLAKRFAELAAQGEEAVGALDLARLAVPTEPLTEPATPRPAPLAAVSERREAPVLGEVAAAAPVAASGARTARHETGYGLVVFSHLRWGFVWQRPQQLLSRIAKEHPVLFVEEPFFDLRPGQPPRIELHRVMPNVTVASPHGPPGWAKRADLPAELRRLTREAIEKSHPDGALEKPVLWYYSPLAASWSLGWFDARGVVYDCMDELSQFAGAPARLVEYEQFLLQHADVVFAGGHELWTKKKELHPNAHFFGCGVEFEHFAQAAEPIGAIPPDIDFMQRPIIGWFGVVDERVDHHLVGEMARLRPDWSFAMIGPIVKIDPNLLSHAPNLYWMGGRDYSVLPSYCRAFDVCFMAFALNAATEFINPTKALEYLATGRPCVSTPVKDVVRQYADVMDIERTPEALVACIERALEAPDPERIRRGIERAREASWERTVEEMLGLVADAAARRARAGAARIEPLAEALLEYAPTPGS